jgi:hypothetical protein
MVADRVAVMNFPLEIDTLSKAQPGCVRGKLEGEII